MENSVQVPKFDGKNFASWKFRIVSILEGKELDDLLEGDPPEDEVKFKEWKKKDTQAKGIITCAMTDSLVALILNCKTSKDIWIALHERYEGDKKKKIIEARNDVSRLTMKKEENWEEYLYRSEKLLEQARNLGAEIEDQEFTTSVIRGLPQKYNLVALQLNGQMKKDIWGAIEPGFPRETSEKQKRKDSLALSVILLAVEDSFLDDIGDCKRAIDAWQILEDIHTKYGLLHILQLLREFFNIVKRNDEDMKEYFARIMECHRKLAKCHHGFGNGELALIMLLGLPKSYEPLILSLEQQEEKLSTSVVKSKLLLEEKRQKQRQIPQDYPNCAFAVRRKEDTCKSPCQEQNKFEYDQPRNYHNMWTEGKRENYNYPRQIRCFSCGRLGHIARNCRFANSSRRISEGISRQIRCFSCGRLGHIARNCRFANSSRRISEGMLKQGTLDLTHKVLFANGFEDNNSQNIWFLDSGATEHMTSNRLKLTNTKSISTSVEMANNEKIKVSEMGDVTIKLGYEYGCETLFLENVLYVPELDGNILSVGRIEEKGNKVLFQNGKASVFGSDGGLILKSNRRGRIYTVEELKKEDEGEYQNEAAIPRGYSGTDGETISVEKDLNNLERREDGEQAYEDEALRREDEGQNETIIPRRSSRIAARQKEYCRSAFHRGIVELKSHQDEMPSSYEEALNMPKAQNRLRSIECEMASLREHRVWDVDLPNGVKRRPNQDLDHSRPPMRNMDTCQVCIQAKHPRTPFKPVLYPQSTRPLDLIHIDLIGPIQEESIGGAKYVLTLVDDFSRKIFVEFLSSKLETFDIIRSFIEEIEKEKEIIVKQLRSDNGKEFTNNQMTQYLKEETIPETYEEVENHDDHSHSDLEHQDEHSELPYNLRPNLKDKLYYELSSDDEPIEDNEDKDPTYDPTVGALKLSHGTLLPSSYEEAINHPDSPLWQQAMDKEIHSLQNHHVWDLTELPEGAKAIKSKWIFSKKMDPQTNQKIYKARLVALGCSQEYGIDYTETFSPVMKTDSFRTLLAYATMAGYEFHHFDVETAFLYGKLSETIYMTQPPGYQDDKKKTSTFVFNMSSSKPSGNKTKRKIADEHRNFQEKWELEYFCSEVKDKIICLICNNAISVPKLYNIKRHYEQHKSKYDSYEGLMRQEKLKEFKLGIKKQQFMFTKVSQESEAAVHASYVLSEIIAKHSKPFTEGDFIKECLIKAAEIVCPRSVKTFQAISLSRNTVVERVTDMARNLNDQIKEKSSCFKAFPLPVMRVRTLGA
ncbi:hypothetical protein LAZ67_10000706 [Cordylochernes scorpioides]|uniref:Retrovirus-related Pol polyprotein from transposon TNT 1-94 n=1 Tax=Cordylochernes scorpioides TaxID=51811 RepID=A0ABY6KV97_9ARAC|nr:hypothetical protein LAZ67_10000706 [Cordylochernes scorpioides]